MQAALEQAYRNQKMVGKVSGLCAPYHHPAQRGGCQRPSHQDRGEIFQRRKLFDTGVLRGAGGPGGGIRGPKASLEDREDNRRPAREQPHDTVTPNQTFFRSVSAQEVPAGAPQRRRTGYSAAAPRRTSVEPPLWGHRAAL